MNDLQGKNALIIGGSNGIGKELCLTLAKNGINLCIHGSKKSQNLDSLIQDCANFGIKAESVTQRFDSDFFKNKQYTELLPHIQKADILCICHGPFIQEALHKTNAEQWELMATMNYAMPGFFVSAALNQMKDRHFGRIILFGGTHTDSIRAFRTNAAYAGAKTGLSVLVKSVALEYAAFNITCNAIMPGLVDSPLLSEETKQKLAEKMPLKKLIPTEKICRCALELISSDAYNGILMNIDSGWN